MVERTLDGGENLKVTITTSIAGGQAQAGDQAREPILRIAGGPTHRRKRSRTSPDSPDHSSERPGNTQESR